MVLAFVGSVVMLFALLDLPDEARRKCTRSSPGCRPVRSRSTSASQADPLSVTWILLVTGVGSLIHLYAIGYMHGDPLFSRFFAYLNLFAASMLILVLGDNFLLTFLGWEGVGLCSYLLISFWFERNSARRSRARRRSSPTASATSASCSRCSSSSRPSAPSTTRR